MTATAMTSAHIEPQSASSPTAHLTLRSPTELLTSTRKYTFAKSLTDTFPLARGKTVVITGGASGIGEATARRLVSLGANVVIGDINVRRGEEIVESLGSKKSEEAGGTLAGKIVFYHCDVFSYESQTEFFRKAAEWAEGGINTVIVNAGIGEEGVLLEEGEEFDISNPPPPPILRTFNINFVGALYTIRLAHHFLRVRNSNAADATDIPDRHILLMGSYSSFLSVPILPMYAAAKHGLLGLFSCLRMTCLPYNHIRVNLVCPYFVKTPIMPAIVKVLLAGQQTVSLDDLVDVIVRLTADRGIMGRMVAVGPGGWAEDVEVGGGLEEVETFGRRVVKVLNGRYWGNHWWRRWGRLFKDITMVLVVAVFGNLAILFWRIGGRRGGV